HTRFSRDWSSDVCSSDLRWVHPDIGMKIAKGWSGHSRIANIEKDESRFLGEDEWLWTYCKELEEKQHHDLYIFGHRHLPLELEEIGRASCRERVEMALVD